MSGYGPDPLGVLNREGNTGILKKGERCPRRIYDRSPPLVSSDDWRRIVIGLFIRQRISKWQRRYASRVVDATMSSGIHSSSRSSCRQCSLMTYTYIVSSASLLIISAAYQTGIVFMSIAPYCVFIFLLALAVIGGRTACAWIKIHNKLTWTADPKSS